MSIPFGEGDIMPSRRGQSTVLGIVLLIGMVAAGSIGILLIAGDMMGSAEQQSEQERIEQAFVELSQSIATVSSSSDVSHTMDFEAGDHGAITQREAGNITIESEYLVDEYGENGLVIPIGSIEYDDSSGTTVAYQAGGVWRGTGENTQMLSAPPLSYQHETLNLPVTSVSEEQTLESGNLRMTYNDTETYGSIPLRDEVVTMTIYSDYSMGWEIYFERHINDAVVTDSQHTGSNPYVEVMLTDLDAEGAFDAGMTVSSPPSEQGGVDHTDENLRRGSMPEMDDIIDQMVEDVDTDANQSWTDEAATGATIGQDEDDDHRVEFTDGVYFADGMDIHDDVTFNLENGNATVVVDGDIKMSGGEFTVENWQTEDGANHSLKIYSTGNFELTGGEMTVDSEDGGANAAQLQVYGKSDSSFGFSGGTFEGVIYAPSSDFDGPHEALDRNSCGDAQFCAHSNPTIKGSIVMGSVHFQGGAGNVFEYDSKLKGADIDIEPDGYSFPPKITYLNIAEHVIDIDQN